ncbi:MAG: OsmC family protein [Anaerolineaceae bacterium]|jgi:uncharacterized OsmC-like protein|nr:OsmC family protein [Anaerolineaceae bacterium]
MPIKNVSVKTTLVEGFKIESRVRQHVVYTDQPPAGGGTDSGPTPPEYLLVSLAGCIVTLGQIIAKQERLPVRNIEVDIEGGFETDVLMGKNTELRAGFSSIRVHVKLDADMTQEEKEHLIHKIDARCPISDNLINLTPIEFVVE